MKKPLIGFIGQGWIGKNYANDFESRGHNVIRYSLDPEYIKNKQKIKKCDIVFIAVPTPTTPGGFSDAIVREAVKLVGKGNIGVIKSTILPGTTSDIQKQNKGIYVVHSPEFLTEASAAYDAAFPKRNIIGIPENTKMFREKAELILSVLPGAPYSVICGALDAEIIKYGRNILGVFRIMFTNILYDLTLKLGGDWTAVRDAIASDPDNGPTYMNPIHKSGRGAGGHCFIKDFAAFTRLYEAVVGDASGVDLLKTLENKNIDLLLKSNKDLDLLQGVYGKDVQKRKK